MWDKIVFNKIFMLKHYLDRNKTQEMCDNIVHAWLPALKFLLDGFVSKKMLEKLDDVLVSNDDAIFVNVHFDNTTFLVMRWVLILHILMMLTLMIIILMKNDPDSLIHVRLMAWCNKHKQYEACKKEITRELMAVACDPTRWWDWCILEDKKK